MQSREKLSHSFSFLEYASSKALQSATLQAARVETKSVVPPCQSLHFSPLDKDKEDEGRRNT